MPKPWDGLIIGARLAMPGAAGTLEALDDGALAWKDGLLVYCGPRHALALAPDALASEVIDARGALVTAGLVDCHTHLVFAGDRAAEYQARQEGASYEQIARMDGGILSTVRATRAAGEADLLWQSARRAAALIGDGVTTLEIKSGYGLELETEARMLRVARALGQAMGVPVRTTFLGAHALPPEYAQRPDAYIDQVCQWLAQLHEQGLVDAVDAFVESIAFSPAQARRVFQAAAALGLPVKLHADQLGDSGGAALAAEFGGLSADHIEYTSAEGVAAMARQGTVAVLLPGAFHVLRETRRPPVELLRAHGVPMAVATDCNPGTSPLLSLRQAMQLACTHFGLTPEEALRGATVNAARALGVHDRGLLQVGLRADFVVWEASAIAELSYWLGGDLVGQVRVAGQRVDPRAALARLGGQAPCPLV